MDITEFRRNLDYDEFAFENIKAKICKVIQVVLDIQSEIRLNAVLFKFKSISMDLLSKQEAFTPEQVFGARENP